MCVVVQAGHGLTAIADVRIYSPYKFHLNGNSEGCWCVVLAVRS